MKKYDDITADELAAMQAIRDGADHHESLPTAKHSELFGIGRIEVDDVSFYLTDRGWEVLAYLELKAANGGDKMTMAELKEYIDSNIPGANQCGQEVIDALTELEAARAVVKAAWKLHTHPGLEQRLKFNSEHVIIDQSDYAILQKSINEYDEVKP